MIQCGWTFGGLQGQQIEAKYNKTFYKPYSSITLVAHNFWNTLFHPKLLSEVTEMITSGLQFLQMKG